MSIGRHPAIRMTDQDKISEPCEFVSRVDDFPVARGDDRRPRRRGDIHAVIALPALIRSETANEPPLNRPGESARRTD